MADVTLWMPQSMDSYARQEYAEAHPGDPHAAAAAAWEDWAAQQDDPAPDASVRAMSTGVQSVTFDGPRSARGQALARAAWHRARARVYSVSVGPEYAVATEAAYFIGPADVATLDDSGNEAVWSDVMP